MNILETEIAIATLDNGFKILDLKRIVALAYPQNEASQYVIKKPGMKSEDDKEFLGVNFLFFSKKNPEYL
ncbi:MAG: GNAT family N-acetyltransferase [Bacteroidota bacterium]|nr:GNAT family N-acetyltransferase [Bacteroidota bacterium]